LQKLLFLSLLELIFVIEIDLPKERQKFIEGYITRTVLIQVNDRLKELVSRQSTIKLAQVVNQIPNAHFLCLHVHDPREDSDDVLSFFLSDFVEYLAQTLDALSYLCRQFIVNVSQLYLLED